MGWTVSHLLERPVLLGNRKQTTMMVVGVHWETGAATYRGKPCSGVEQSQKRACLTYGRGHGKVGLTQRKLAYLLVLKHEYK
jgi:hypothetical protein